MKTMVLLMALTCSFFITTAQTLQTVTDNGSSTTNTLNALNPNGYQVTGSVGNPAYMVIDQTANSGGKRWRFGHTGAAPGFGSFDLLNITDGIIPLSITPGGNVGIGLTNPTHKLDVIGHINVVGQSGGFATGDIPKLSFGSSDTEFSEFSLPYGGPLEYKAFHGHVFKTYGNASSAVERMRIDINGNVGVGTLTPQEKLSVNGKIRAHEIKVETANWPDFVFAKEYQLPTLLETEKHIKEKGHLPGIPSATEAKANGIDLGEMNAKLLQKIEELTLHLIEMKKDNNQLKQMYQQQQQQIDNLNRKN